MSKYKHGDWYCVPANEVEAKEIIERAVVSGAVLYETPDPDDNYGYKWNLCSAWGVYYGRTHTGGIGLDGSFRSTKEYTLPQLREMFPLPDEQVANSYPHGDWYCKPVNKEEAEEIIKRAMASGAELYDTTDLNSICGYKWNLCYAWGVYQGKTHTGGNGWDDTFEGVKEYTIDQLRELFPLHGERGEGFIVLHDLDTPISGCYLTDVFSGSLEKVTLVCDHRAGVQGALRQCGQAMSRKTDFVSYWGDWVAHNQAGEKVAKWGGEGWPPVGTEVEYTAVIAEHSRCIVPGSWYRGTVIAYHNGAVWTSDNGIRQLSNTIFRPLRSKRDQWVIDTQTYFNETLGEVCPSEGVLVGIYDAIKSGDLKAPELG